MTTMELCNDILINIFSKAPISIAASDAILNAFFVKHEVYDWDTTAEHLYKYGCLKDLEYYMSHASKTKPTCKSITTVYRMLLGGHLKLAANVLQRIPEVTDKVLASLLRRVSHGPCVDNDEIQRFVDCCFTLSQSWIKYTLAQSLASGLHQCCEGIKMLPLVEKCIDYGAVPSQKALLKAVGAGDIHTTEVLLAYRNVYDEDILAMKVAILHRHYDIVIFLMNREGKSWSVSRLPLKEAIAMNDMDLLDIYMLHRGVSQLYTMYANLTDRPDVLDRIFGHLDDDGKRTFVDKMADTHNWDELMRLSSNIQTFNYPPFCCPDMIVSAIKAQRYDVAKWLGMKMPKRTYVDLKKVYNPESWTHSINSPLALDTRHKLIHFILEEFGTGKIASNGNWETWLLMAVEAGIEDAVHAILCQHVVKLSIPYSDSVTSSPFLAMACAVKHVEIAKMLLAAGAEVTNVCLKYASSDAHFMNMLGFTV